MVNFDPNIQGEKLRARRLAWEERQRLRNEQQRLKLDEQKEKRAIAEHRLLRTILVSIDDAQLQAVSVLLEAIGNNQQEASIWDVRLLSFLVQQTRLGRRAPDVARALDQVASKDHVNMTGLMTLLRDYAVPEDESMASFEDCRKGRESVPALEAKAHMVHLALKTTEADFGKEKWDNMADCVLGLRSFVHQEVVRNFTTGEDEEEEEDSSKVNVKEDVIVDRQRYLTGCRDLCHCVRLLQFLESRLRMLPMGALFPASRNISYLFSTAGIEDVLFPKDPDSWSVFSDAVRKCRSQLKALRRTQAAQSENRHLAETVDTTNNNSNNNNPSLGGSNEQSCEGQQQLPPVALRCSLCLAARGLCSFHSRDATSGSGSGSGPSGRAPPPPPPAAGRAASGAAVGASASASATGLTASPGRAVSSTAPAFAATAPPVATSAAVGGRAAGGGAAAGGSSVRELVPKSHVSLRCDLCKAAGGTCAYHASKTKDFASSNTLEGKDTKAVTRSSVGSKLRAQPGSQTGPSARRTGDPASAAKESAAPQAKQRSGSASRASNSRSTAIGTSKVAAEKSAAEAPPAPPSAASLKAAAVATAAANAAARAAATASAAAAAKEAAKAAAARAAVEAKRKKEAEAAAAAERAKHLPFTFMPKANASVFPLLQQAKLLSAREKREGGWLHDLCRHALADAIEAEDVSALGDAIMAASACGMPEDELLPVFEVFEELAVLKQLRPEALMAKDATADAPPRPRPPPQLREEKEEEEEKVEKEEQHNHQESVACASPTTPIVT